MSIVITAVPTNKKNPQNHFPGFEDSESKRQDLNLRPLRPERSALPN